MGNKTRPQRHGPLAELAKRQQGVVSIRQLRALGYSPSTVTKAVSAGRLHRVARGVYAVGHAKLDAHARCLVAVLSSAPDALLSHGSAAWLWGLYRYPPTTIDVTAPTRRHARRDLRLHHAKLTEDDRAVRAGIPVTSVARTLLDLAASLAPAQLERLLERAEELGLFDLGGVDALLDRAAGHPGAASLRRAIAIYRDDPTFNRSMLEKRFRALAKNAGLPPHAANVNVGGYELDAYWERERFAVELDVYETHGTRLGFERDRIREDDLQLLGIETIRVTGPRLDREPEEIMRRIAAHLARRCKEFARRGEITVKL